MQSSMWSNPSAGMSQQQHHEHHHHQHQHQSEAHQPQSSTPRHYHDGVWTPPPPPPPPPPQQHQAATSTTAAFRLAAGKGFSVSAGSNDDELIRPSVSFPLLNVADSSSEHSAIPLARRQQNYLQQRQQQLLLQQEASEPTLETEAAEPGAPVTDEAALKLAMKRKQLRHRALIMIYLSCTLLFVLAVVFLSAFGVFHTAGIEEAAKADKAAKAANVTDGAGSLLPA